MGGPVTLPLTDGRRIILHQHPEAGAVATLLNADGSRYPEDAVPIEDALRTAFQTLSPSGRVPSETRAARDMAVALIALFHLKTGDPA